MLRVDFGFLFLIVVMGCGVVAPDVHDNEGRVGESGCGDLGYYCQLGEECLRNKEGGFYCGCAEGMTSCPGGRICGTKTIDDMENCGACGNRCHGDGVKCEGGKCVCYEGEKAVDLNNGRYLDGSGRAKSCGVCGYECAQGGVGSEILCEGGMCVDLSCELGLDGKSKMRCGDECKDLMRDSEHCGRCGVACGNGECKDGKCVCVKGEFACGEGGACVEGSDLVCGKGCEDCVQKGRVCRDGVCACAEGSFACGEGGACVEESDSVCGESCEDCTKRSDGRLHCYKGRCVGEKDKVCGADGLFSCGDGEVCDCKGGLRCWGGKCQCGGLLGDAKVCSESEWCVNDVCKCGKEAASAKKCSGGESCGADGVCHCGVGLGCKAGEVCVEGVCKCGSRVCGSGEVCKNGECKCGEGNACAEGEVCVGGVCKCGKDGGNSKICLEGEKCSADGRCLCGDKVCGELEKCDKGVCKCGNIVGGCGESAKCNSWKCVCNDTSMVPVYNATMDVFRRCESTCLGRKCASEAICVEDGSLAGCRCQVSTGHAPACEGSTNACKDNGGCYRPLVVCGAGTMKLREQIVLDENMYYSGCVEKCNNGLCAQGANCVRYAGSRKEICTCILDKSETSFETDFSECPVGKVCEGKTCQ